MKFRDYLSEGKSKGNKKELQQWSKKMKTIENFFKSAGKQKIGEINPDVLTQDDLNMAKGTIAQIREQLDILDEQLDEQLDEAKIYEYKKVQTNDIDKHLKTVNKFEKWIKKNKKEIGSDFEGKMLLKIIEDGDFEDYVLDVLNDMKKVMKE